MPDETRVWGIHTLNESQFTFLKDNIIAIGWNEMGDLSKIAPDRESFKEKYNETYHDDNKYRAANGVGMLYRFTCEAKVGDYVVFPSKFNREVNIGVIESDYYYAPEAIHYVQQRKVKWLKHIPRTCFTQGALHEIGCALTFFAVRNYAVEFLSALDKDFKKKKIDEDVEDETVAATAEEIRESTIDFILKELSRKLKGYDLEDFVADLLNAMGYKATISPHGGDGGVDITAYKDELPPRILVQVKSQDSNIKEETVLSLKGAMHEGDYGLFVTLSKYTKNAQKFLDNTPIIRGIDGQELVELILKYYDRLSEKSKKIIPLEKVYIPVISDM